MSSSGSGEAASASHPTVDPELQQETRRESPHEAEPPRCRLTQLRHKACKSSERNLRRTVAKHREGECRRRSSLDPVAIPLHACQENCVGKTVPPCGTFGAQEKSLTSQEELAVRPYRVLSTPLASCCKCVLVFQTAHRVLFSALLLEAASLSRS